MRKTANFLGLATAALLVACTTSEPPPPAASVAGIAETRQLLQDIPAFAGARPALVSSDEIYRLSAARRDAFLDYYHDPMNRNVPGHKRIGQYLLSSKSAFNYIPETRTADEVYELEGGNCLSLANITTALARLAGVEVGYQLRDDIPVYELQENIILRGVHVRSILYQPLPELNAGDGGARLIIPFGGRASVIIDYFPTGRSRYIRRISESEFTAMYYRNLAGEAIVAGDFPPAYWLVKESMLHAPDHAEAINMLAVLYRRSGDEWAAEQIYLYGLNSARERLSLLKNYRTLLREQGRTAEAGEMTRRLARYNDADPFEWWFLAEDAYGEEKYSDALSYYKKSVEIAPYLHEGYFGMAKTYYQLGRVKSARSAMRQAIENADRPRFKTLYEAKLKALSGGQAN
ncbi:MAG: tetratricopeptide repeat protein [Proteobacteria bacterium]|nr:tetratricopeptide repeat protein [Pseudomonadota bacterium]